jgi:hypothetical protein
MRLTLDILKKIAEKFEESGYPIEDVRFYGECVRKAIKEDLWLEDFDIIFICGGYLNEEGLIKHGIVNKNTKHRCKYTGQILGYTINIDGYNLIFSINIYGIRNPGKKIFRANNQEIRMRDLIQDNITNKSEIIKHVSTHKIPDLTGLNSFDIISLLRDGYVEERERSEYDLKRLLAASDHVPHMLRRNQVLGLFEYKTFNTLIFSKIIGSNLNSVKEKALKNLEEYNPFGERIIPRVIILSYFSPDNKIDLLEHHLGLMKTWKRDINSSLIILKNVKKYLDRNKISIESIGRMMKRLTSFYKLEDYFTEEYLLPVIKSIFNIEDWEINKLKDTIETLTIKEVTVPVTGKDILQIYSNIDKGEIGELLEEISIKFDENPKLTKKELLNLL